MRSPTNPLTPLKQLTGNQVVQYAAILYPGSYQSYSGGEIEVLPAYPGNEAKLQQHLYPVLDKALTVV